MADHHCVQITSWVASLRGRLTACLQDAATKGAPELMRVLQTHNDRFRALESHVAKLDSRDAQFRDVCRKLFVIAVRVVQDLRDTVSGNNTDTRINMGYLQQVQTLASDTLGRGVGAPPSQQPLHPHTHVHPRCARG